ncbi:hypothetical protein DPMN_019002 [Dreissena polymorpha]|uniref:Uncharacterized protein n=1 Tax=Dreissena polymorpha TaxID=45954 RepID=A0A9D4NE88_DREPO|nr:hypothetical protein DPMN_080797 [Dreissena polymorpha]KAH3894843.1 hypothetical protein DPMN_019002 [Dreissena polymorpha]
MDLCGMVSSLDGAQPKLPEVTPSRYDGLMKTMIQGNLYGSLEYHQRRQSLSKESTCPSEFSTRIRRLYVTHFLN